MSQEVASPLPADAVAAAASKSATFPIIYDNRKYLVNPIVAATLSHKLAYLFQSDPLVSEFAYETDLKGDFEPARQCLNGAPVKFDGAAAPFLLSVAAELQIEALACAAASSVPQEALAANGFQLLRAVYDSGINCDAVMGAVAARFEKLDLAVLKSLPVAILDAILRSPALLVENRPRLLAFLRDVFDWRAAPNHRLAKFLPFSIMEEADAASILENPRLNLNTMKYALLRAGSRPGSSQ
jgi:hypothetical protein